MIGGQPQDAEGYRRFISGSSLPEWSRGRVEASTRELIDGCSMAIGPLDCVEAIVLHACFFDWINHGDVRLAAKLRAAKGLAAIADVLKATDVQWGIPEHTAVQDGLDIWIP